VRKTFVLIGADIEHTKTKICHPKTNGICERFHKTILLKLNQPTWRRIFYGSIEELQHDLGEWLVYNKDEFIKVKSVVGERE